MTTVDAPAVNLLTSLSPAEMNQINMMVAQLGRVSYANRLHESYYDGTARIKNLGIAVPPALAKIETIVGWPETSVGVLDDRINLQGFGQATETDDAGIGKIITENKIISEAPQGHVDALIYGVSFISVGSGQPGEPDPLVTFESPLSTTGIWDRRLRRLSAALTQQVNPESRQVERVSLFLPNQTIIAEVDGSGRWKVTDRDEHKIGRPLIVRLVNRPRTSDPFGRSEITRVVRSLTDNAVRTLLGMEVAREFYSAPQRYVLGAPEAAFQDANGNPKPAWESYMGRYLALDAGDDDEGKQRTITAGQFEAASMEPFAGQIRVLSEILASSKGFPASYLGFITDNPPSADGTRAMEARLVKRAERCNLIFGAAEAEAIELACRVRDGEWPAPGIHAQYGDPATPTIGATTDAVMKQVEAGVLPPTSDVTLQRLGYTPAERLRIKSGQ